MTISEFISALEELRTNHGDIEVRMLDTYWVNEGWTDAPADVPCDVRWCPVDEHDPEIALIFDVE